MVADVSHSGCLRYNPFGQFFLKKWSLYILINNCSSCYLDLNVCCWQLVWQLNARSSIFCLSVIIDSSFVSILISICAFILSHLRNK